jgi:hypothetical protein
MGTAGAGPAGDALRQQRHGHAKCQPLSRGAHYSAQPRHRYTHNPRYSLIATARVLSARA